jgi:hypothetical protein
MSALFSLPMAGMFIRHPTNYQLLTQALMLCWHPMPTLQSLVSPVLSRVHADAGMTLEN